MCGVEVWSSEVARDACGTRIEEKFRVLVEAN